MSPAVPTFNLLSSRTLRAYRPALSFSVPCSLPQCQGKPAGTLETSPEFSLSLYPHAQHQCAEPMGVPPSPLRPPSFESRAHNRWKGLPCSLLSVNRPASRTYLRGRDEPAAATCSPARSGAQRLRVGRGGGGARAGAGPGERRPRPSLSLRGVGPTGLFRWAGKGGRVWGPGSIRATKDAQELWLS